MGYAYWKNGRVYVGFKNRRGRHVQQATEATTLTEGKRIATDLERREERIRLGLELPPPPPTTFAALAERYLAEVASQKRSRGTITSRVNVHLLPAFGERQLPEIRPGDIEGFLARKSENLKPQSVEHLRRTLHVMFAFALRAELLRGDNPVSKVPRRVIPENEIRFIEPENVATLIAAVPTRWRNLFAAAVYLGARKGELLALRVRSVDLQRRCVTLARSHDGATKSGKVRVVAIPDELVPFLEDAVAQTKSEFLFPGPNGKRRSPHVRLEVILRRALVKAKVIDSWRHVCRRPSCGEVVEAEDATARRCPKCDFALWPVPVPPHLNFKDLRSTWATTAYEATGDVRFVQAGLGHSDPRLTEQRYAAARARRMLEQANKVRFGAVPPVSYPVLTGAPETPNPPLLSESTGSMNLSTYDQRACPDSNRGPLASEAHDRRRQPMPGVSLHRQTSHAQVAQLVAVEQISPVLSYPVLTGAPLLTVSAVAKRLGVCEATVYGLVNRGELAHTRLLTNAVRIAPADLEAYLAAHRTGGRR